MNEIEGEFHFPVWFDVQCSLKQGCPSSSMFFNLYINGLVMYMKGLEQGICIGEKKICISLYADDIVLLAENAQDRRTMLDVLAIWCSQNKMVVNCDKSNVVHLRNSSISKTEHVFLWNIPFIEK